MEVSTMPTGSVKWFDPKKGEGFIERQGGPDVFVRAATGRDLPPLTAGVKVEFTVREGRSGPEAQDVKVIDIHGEINA
jgi:CspA family cold shock protein